MNSTISQGILDNFFVFEVFDNSKGDSIKKYIRTLEKLAKTNLIISDISLEKEVTFRDSFSEAVQVRKVYLNKREDSLTSHIKGDFINISDEELFTGYGEQPLKNGDPIRIDLLEESQKIHLHRFVKNNIREEIYTNHSLLDIKNTFMLYPMRVILNGKSAFVDVRITIYKHGYAILNFSIKLNDIDIEKFNKQIWITDIEAAYLPSFMLNIEKKDQYTAKTEFEKIKYNKLGGTKNLYEALERYQAIVKSIFGKKVREAESFHTLMVPKAKDLGEQSTNVFKRNIYKLLHAPVISSPNQKFINSFFENNMFESKGFNNTYGNQHRLLYLVTEEQYKGFREDYNINIDSIITEHFYEAFRGDFFFAIEKLMLKKISNWKYMNNFFGESISARKLHKISLNKIYESRYESNQIFYKYGSVRDLIEVLFKSCLDSNVESLLEANKKRVLEASELRRNIILSEVSVITSILVILLTSILSIPALTQTMTFFNIKNDSIIVICYFIILVLVITAVITAFRDKITRFFYNITSFFKTIIREYKAYRNTQRFLRRKNGK